MLFNTLSMRLTKVTLREKCRTEVFIKKGILRNFTKFPRKHLWQSLFFNEVAGRPATLLLKKRLCHRYFPVTVVKFLGTSFGIEHLWCLFLHNSDVRWFVTIIRRKLLCEIMGCICTVSFSTVKDFVINKHEAYLKLKNNWDLYKAH